MSLWSHYILSAHWSLQAYNFCTTATSETALDLMPKETNIFLTLFTTYTMVSPVMLSLHHSICILNEKQRLQCSDGDELDYKNRPISLNPSKKRTVVIQ